MTTKIDFWDCDEWAETLYHRDQADAIHDFLEGLNEEDLLSRIEAKETIRLHGFRHRAISKTDIGDPLEAILDNLGEEYGNPNDLPDGPSDAMRAASDALVAAVLAEYQPWSCESVPEAAEDVDVAKWVAENEPEWLVPVTLAPALPTVTRWKTGGS